MSEAEVAESGAALRYASEDGLPSDLGMTTDPGMTTTDGESFGEEDDHLLNATAAVLTTHGREVAEPLAATAPAPAAAEAEGEGEDEEEEEEDDDDDEFETYEDDEDAYEAAEAAEPQPEPQPQPQDELSRAEALALKKVSARGTSLSLAEQKLFGLSTDGRPLRSRFQVRARKVTQERTSALARPKASARTTNGASEAWVRANTKCTCRGERKKRCRPAAPQPGCARAQQVHALVEDAKNCTFAPTRSRRADAAMRDPKCGYDFLGREDDDNFLNRMEARERSRQLKLEKKRGEAEYDARQDKKRCPQCGLVQSYDEVRSRKKKCPNCHVEYRPARAWGDIGAKFLERCEEKAAVRERKLRETAKAVTPGFALAKTTFESRHKRAVDAKLAGTSFLDRMEKDQAKRRDNQTLNVQRAVEAQAAESVAAAAAARSRAEGKPNSKRAVASSFEQRMAESVTLREKKLKKFDRKVGRRR